MFEFPTHHAINAMFPSSTPPSTQVLVIDATQPPGTRSRTQVLDLTGVDNGQVTPAPWSDTRGASATDQLRQQARGPVTAFIECGGLPQATTGPKEIVFDPESPLHCLVGEMQRPGAKVAIINPSLTALAPGESDATRGFSEHLKYVSGMRVQLSPTPGMGCEDFTMISMRFPHKRDMASISSEQVRDGVYHQVAHALRAAGEQGISTAVISLHGSIEHGPTEHGAGTGLLEQRPEVVADAVVRATQDHGSGLRVVVPSHGPAMDAHVSARAGNLKTASLQAQSVWTPTCVTAPTTS